MSAESRHSEVCPSCGAAGYGNATCSVCVKEWPRFGISKETVAQVLNIIGDRPPVPPFGTVFH